MDAHEQDRSLENPKPTSNVGENNDGHRHGKSKSSWGLSSAVHAVHGVGYVAKKVYSNRYTDSLWHSKKSSSSTSDHASSDVRRENQSHDNVNVNHHASNEFTSNVHEKGRNVDTKDLNVGDELEDFKPKDVVDQSEINTKHDVKPFGQDQGPSNVVDHKKKLKLGVSSSSHVKQVNQQRWPSATSSNVVNQAENLEPSDGSQAKVVNQQRWPGKVVGSNVLNKTINHPYEANMAPNVRRTSKTLTESTNDGTTALTPARDGSSVTGVKPSPAVRGTSLTPANQSASDSTKGVHQNTAKRVSKTLARAVIPALVRGASPTPNSQSRTRGVSPTPSRGVKLNPAVGVSATPTREVSPTPTREISPTASRGISSTASREVSPTRTTGVGPCTTDVSDTTVKPHKSSGRRHFFNASILSVFTNMVDNKKEKHVVSLKDIAQDLELLYNIQVQWQFANASAEAALNLQRETAEKSLFDMWRTIVELRDRIASKKVNLNLMILQLKLYAVLYRQMAYIDEWAAIKKEHESALFATTNDLQARSLSVPITGGAKVDIKDLKLIVYSTIQVLQATMSRVQLMLSKLDKTHFLASELANLVLHERALLDECEIFLASAAPLHIEEFSLRSYLLQSNRTNMTE